MSYYTEYDVPDQTGKTVFITGANTGIGFETARVLAVRGAKVLLGCRSEEKANQAIEKIMTINKAAQLEWVPLDLISLQSVSQAAARVLQEERLDVLINNAGVMMPPKTLTEDGFELQFGVNHLGHFALTLPLLDLLGKTPGSRVVNVSSLAHRQGRIDFDDLQASKSYNPMPRYGMSKVANLYFTFELGRFVESKNLDIICCACHPGVAETELSRHLPGWYGLVAPFVRPWFNTPAEGALPTLMAATGDDVATGDYYGPQMRGETARSAGRAHISSHAKDDAIAKRLWEVSTELTGLG